MTSTDDTELEFIRALLRSGTRMDEPTEDPTEDPPEDPTDPTPEQLLIRSLFN